MKPASLSFLVCPECRFDALEARSFDRAAANPTRKTVEADIHAGVVLCSQCRSWFPILEGVLHLLPSSMNQQTREAFASAYRDQLGRLGHGTRKKTLSSSAKGPNAHDAQKLSQQSFFDSFSHDYVLERQSFWLAYYGIVLSRFLRFVSPGSTILDLGCGSGLASGPFIRRGDAVVGIDISPSMVKRARELHPHGSTRAEFIVGDAEDPPVKDGFFDACIGFGILHHVSNPFRTLAGIRRALKNNGFYIGHENNRTFVRPLFDRLQAFFPQWHEEAGPYQTFTVRQLKEACLRAGMDAAITTAVYLPPHFFNLFSVRIARWLLEMSDRLVGWVPWLRTQGGTLIIEAVKIPMAARVG